MKVPTSHFERKGRGAGRGGAGGHEVNCSLNNKHTGRQVHKVNLAYTGHLILRYARPSNLYTTMYEYDTIRPSMRLVKESSHQLQSVQHAYIHIHRFFTSFLRTHRLGLAPKVVGIYIGGWNSDFLEQ